MKATESTDYTDPSFTKNWAGAHAAGLIRTAYHFAHPAVDAGAQATYFVDTVRAAGGWNASSTLPLMLDLEDADKLPPAAVWAWVRAFTAAVQAKTGKSVLMYTCVKRKGALQPRGQRAFTLAQTPPPRNHPAAAIISGGIKLATRLTTLGRHCGWRPTYPSRSCPPRGRTGCVALRCGSARARAAAAAAAPTPAPHPPTKYTRARTPIPPPPADVLAVRRRAFSRSCELAPALRFPSRAIF